MGRRPYLLSLLLLAVPFAAAAQQAALRSEPVTGLRDNTPGVHALTGARIVVAPGQVLDNATLIARDGRIEAVGTNVVVPPDALVHDMAGRTLYPGFIDAYADLGLDDVRENGDPGPAFWNPQVRSYFDAALQYVPDPERIEALRSQGFAVAHAVPRLGIFRGQTALVSLGDRPPRESVVGFGVAQSVGLGRSNQLGNTYPNSDMGAIALIRQTFLDADWYRRARAAYAANPTGLTRPETNLALERLDRAESAQQPVLFETSSEVEFLRVQKLAEEFGLDAWVRGSGEEYRLLDVLGPSVRPLVVPLDFPDPPDVERPEEALDESLEDLRHWYLAPENPARLEGAGVEFALTADELDDPSDFLSNLRQAVSAGLSADGALAALTTVPARLLGVEGTHGTLEAGKVANLVVVEGDLFAGAGQVRDVWVDGVRHPVSIAPRVDPRGTWTLTASDSRLSGTLEVEGSPTRIDGSLEAGGEEVDFSSASAGNEAGRVWIDLPGEPLGLEGTIRLSGSVSGSEMYGWAELPDGSRPSWRAQRGSAPPSAAAPSPPPERPQLTLPDIRPAMEYGRAALPAQPANVLVTNATVWTQGPQGRLENADLLVSQGRVLEVGTDLDAPAGATVIDASGKHVTPGLIDAHLHSGVTGINESGSAIVPEVRLADVLTHNNIWMYRQLAGGLTLAHVKHGSANPIGGQNVIVKMRWGALPDALVLDSPVRTVKFALGENPTRNTGRYPDTRMGVEQIISDHFMAARDYQRAWERWEATGEGIPPRRDLRMDALVDILEGELWISSHGYRQDEFLMLVRLAEEFGFRVRTLQHGVEAYKIAPELAASGVAAVVWSDWSSFKVEAYDATTYNARILSEAGVLTSLHSDDSQLAARMNWEAGKLLRTGLGEEASLAMVTLNPARILGIDDRVGSLEAGKDADFVIWSGNPLSQFTKAEQTWVDGRRYFDLEEDLRMQDQVERERAMLIRAALQSR